MTRCFHRGRMMDRLEAHRLLFARLVTANAGVPAVTGARLVDAFASRPRERFVGAGPWRVFTRGLHRDTVVPVGASTGYYSANLSTAPAQ